MPTHPNLLFVFGDQWRAQAVGYAGDANVRTPHIDHFAAESVNFANAVSCCPVCSPYRASLMTGQYPLTHGMFVNDQPIRGDSASFADALNDAGYHTAYIGKWHINGNGRNNYVPPERRLGFQWWRGYECNHDYRDSCYWADRAERLQWEGYDADAQTVMACEYLERREDDRPFALFLSWGPPHNPFGTAPEEFQAMYDPAKITLRPNVPADQEQRAREELAGYYAHCSALDACYGRLLETLEKQGLAEDTIVVFTSDHGDMLGSHGLWRKQHPHEESILVPFLLRWPRGLGEQPRTLTRPINAPDIMPTLLGLCGASIPETVEGDDISPLIRGEVADGDGAALIACYRPFHEINYQRGGRDYRGLRTSRYTYARDHSGPWKLFDNQADPYQQRNLADDAACRELIESLETELHKKLAETHDDFLTGDELVQRYNIRLNERGDIYYE